jgi:hypothetical protein
MVTKVDLTLASSMGASVISMRAVPFESSVSLFSQENTVIANIAAHSNAVNFVFMVIGFLR